MQLHIPLSSFSAVVAALVLLGRVAYAQPDTTTVDSLVADTTLADSLQADTLRSDSGVDVVTLADSAKLKLDSAAVAMFSDTTEDISSELSEARRFFSSGELCSACSGLWAK